METEDRNALPDRAGDALGQLVLDHCRDSGDSLAAIARRGGMSRQTLSAIIHRAGPISVPRPDTLQRLAQGLGIPLAVVEKAAAAAVATDGAAAELEAELRLRTLIGYASALSDTDLRVLLATARAMRSARPVA